jgi:hypothetical protein
MVAQKMLEDRKGDPTASDDGHAASMMRGAHRPDPDNPSRAITPRSTAPHPSALPSPSGMSLTSHRSQATLLTQRRSEKCAAKALRRS